MSVKLHQMRGEISRRDPGKAPNSFLHTLRAQRHKNGISPTDVGQGDVVRSHSSGSEILRRNQGCRYLELNKHSSTKRCVLPSGLLVLFFASGLFVTFDSTS